MVYRHLFPSTKLFSERRDCAPPTGQARSPCSPQEQDRPADTQLQLGGTRRVQHDALRQRSESGVRWWHSDGGGLIRPATAKVHLTPKVAQCLRARPHFPCARLLPKCPGELTPDAAQGCCRGAAPATAARTVLGMQLPPVQQPPPPLQPQPEPPLAPRALSMPRLPIPMWPPQRLLLLPAPASDAAARTVVAAVRASVATCAAAAAAARAAIAAQIATVAAAHAAAVDCTIV